MRDAWPCAEPQGRGGLSPVRIQSKKCGATAEPAPQVSTFRLLRRLYATKRSLRNVGARRGELDPVRELRGELAEEGARVSAFFTLPSPSNQSPTEPRYISGCCSVGMSRKASDWRR